MFMNTYDEIQKTFPILLPFTATIRDTPLAEQSLPGRETSREPNGVFAFTRFGRRVGWLVSGLV